MKQWVVTLLFQDGDGPYKIRAITVEVDGPGGFRPAVRGALARLTPEERKHVRGYAADLFRPISEFQDEH